MIFGNNFHQLHIICPRVHSSKGISMTDYWHVDKTSYWITKQQYPWVLFTSIEHGLISILAWISHYTPSYQIEAEATWPSFSRRHIQMHFLERNVNISINISLNFVPRGPIKNILTLMLIMARYRAVDKPLFEPMMVSLATHICVTRPQWGKITYPFPNFNGCTFEV